MRTSKNGMVEKLRGGDLRSTGRGNLVARFIVRDTATFAAVFDAVFGDDPVVRARAADACEKASAKKPALLVPHKKRLLAALKTERQQEVQWHLAQMVPRLPLTATERMKAAAVFTRWFQSAKSRIVRVFSMQAVCDMALAAPALLPAAQRMIAHAAASNIPSLAARARKLRTVMEPCNVHC